MPHVYNITYMYITYIYSMCYSYIKCIVYVCYVSAGHDEASFMYHSIIPALSSLSLSLYTHAPAIYNPSTCVCVCVVHVSRKTLGDDHPSTLTSINNFAELLKDQGKLEEAEPLYREALNGR